MNAPSVILPLKPTTKQSISSTQLPHYLTRVELLCLFCSPRGNRLISGSQWCATRLEPKRPTFHASPTRGIHDLHRCNALCHSMVLAFVRTSGAQRCRAKRPHLGANLFQLDSCDQAFAKRRESERAEIWFPRLLIRSRKRRRMRYYCVFPICCWFTFRFREIRRLSWSSAFRLLRHAPFCMF